MTEEERTKKQKALVEATGIIYEKEGLQPISGRILGLLTIMDKEIFTFDEIIEELQISKGSASSAIKMLELRNVIEYITIAGDRKRYFQIKKIDKFKMIDESRAKLELSRDFLQNALHLKADKNSENALYINNLINMLDFFIGKFQELKQEYETGK
jgi:DNA-binding transcriptional regulator GbsR (MarR family)